MNIILVGFMGAGKTSIGKKLAKRLGYQFLDTDQAIEIQQKKPISQIFTEEGEPAFRALETAMLRQLLGRNNLVISTGGGILTTPGNWELIKRLGTSVFLWVDLEAIYERVTRNNKRPKLLTQDPRKTIQELFGQRKDLYLQADVIIESDGKESMQALVTRIIREL